MADLGYSSDSDDSSESSLNASEGEGSARLTKQDKSLIFDSVLATKFADPPGYERSEYRCDHNCHMCNNCKQSGANLSWSNNFQQHENDFSFDSDKRRMIIESIVHEHFETQWRVQRERLIEIQSRLEDIRDKYSATQRLISSTQEPEVTIEANKKQFEDPVSKNQPKMNYKISGIRCVQNLAVGPKKEQETTTPHILIEHRGQVLKDNDSPDPHIRLVHGIRGLSLKNLKKPKDNCVPEPQRKTLQLIPKQEDEKTLYYTVHPSCDQEFNQLKRVFSKIQDSGPAEKRRKIADRIPSQLQKNEMSNISRETHQQTMKKQYGPIKRYSGVHNYIVINSPFQTYKRHYIKKSVVGAHAPSTNNVGKAAMSCVVDRSEPVTTSKRDHRTQERKLVKSTVTVNQRQEGIKPKEFGYNKIPEQNPKERGKFNAKPPAQSGSETRSYNSSSSPMNIKDDVFYIDRQYVDVILYWDGLRRERWNPTQCVYEICSSMYWGTPVYIQIDYVVMQGYIFALTVKEHTFMPDKRVMRKKDARHLASVEFLKYLGFEFDYVPENPLSNEPSHYNCHCHRQSCPW